MAEFSWGDKVVTCDGHVGEIVDTKHSINGTSYKVSSNTIKGSSDTDFYSLFYNQDRHSRMYSENELEKWSIYGDYKYSNSEWK